jgi:hypothetical protein
VGAVEIAEKRLPLPLFLYFSQFSESGKKKRSNKRSSLVKI